MHDLNLRLDETLLAMVRSKVASEESTQLVDYFREVSREYISSCGSTDSVRRIFPDTQAYRSPLLDMLHAQAGDTNMTFALLPGLNELRRQMLFVPESAIEVADKMKRAKRLEFELVEKYAGCEIQANEDKLPAFKAIALSLGYSVSQKTASYSNGSLQLFMHIDPGQKGRLSWGVNIGTALMFSDSSEGVNLNWNRVHPVFDYYNMCSSTRECLLSIYANLTAARCFLHTLKV